jgi:hypothetical protein
MLAASLGGLLASLVTTSTRQGKEWRGTYTLRRGLLCIRRLSIGRLAVGGLLGILLVGVIVGTLGRLRRWIVAEEKPVSSICNAPVSSEEPNEPHLGVGLTLAVETF